MEPLSKNGTGVLVKLVAVSLVAMMAWGCGQATRMPRMQGDMPGHQAMYNIREARKIKKNYLENPKDKRALMSYVKMLGTKERWSEVVAVLRDAVLRYPHDKRLAAAYGKALALNGRLHQALRVVRAANSPLAPDWRLLSAEAAILDCLNRSVEARAVYEAALVIAPNEPSLLNNYALSFLVSGNPKGAEHILRQAVKMPGANERIRNNLSLVLSIQEKFDEAESLEDDANFAKKHDAKKEIIAKNEDELKDILLRQNAWQESVRMPSAREEVELNLYE